MRHRKKSTVTLNVGIQKKSLVIRNLLTSLVKYGHITTTTKRAFVLKAKANAFFSQLVRTMKKRDEKDGHREAIRIVKGTIFGEQEGKKVVEELLPRFIKEDKTSYIADYKLGARKGDAAEEVIVKII